MVHSIWRKWREGDEAKELTWGMAAKEVDLLPGLEPWNRNIASRAASGDQVAFPICTH